MKYFAFLIALGAVSLTLASFMAPSSRPVPPFSVGIDLMPRFPLTVVKVKGRVKQQNRRLREGNRITNITRIKFDSTTNIIKVRDTNGQGFFIVPRDFELPAQKACNSTICKPTLMEKMSVPGGF